MQTGDNEVEILIKEIGKSHTLSYQINAVFAKCLIIAQKSTNIKCNINKFLTYSVIFLIFNVHNLIVNSIVE